MVYNFRQTSLKTLDITLIKKIIKVAFIIVMVQNICKETSGIFRGFPVFPVFRVTVFLVIIGDGLTMITPPVLPENAIIYYMYSYTIVVFYHQLKEFEI